ncbi:MAG: hypothetical protein LBO72_09315 [Helicobacteraceae bacterium]|jgi:hypothetical protein|nr:hypothetical protein [Helicobacteraceae bacterium]
MKRKAMMLNAIGVKGKAIAAALLLALVLSFAVGFSGCESKSDAKSSASAEENIPAGYTKEGGEIVNGFTLPPYPDPKVNDSTLLGIDSNNNGVRDDVERWLIFKYKDDHRIVTEIGFQGARASQEILKASPNTYEEALAVDEIMRKAFDCNSYFKSYAKVYGDPVLIDHTIITSIAFKTMQFNTEQRIRSYLAYDKALSGEVYGSTKSSQKKAQCSFEAHKLLGE